MSALTDPFYSRKQLIEIATENQIDKKYHDTFINLVEECMQDLYNDNELEESERGIIAISQTLEEIVYFIIEIEKGHSESWARIYSLSFEDGSERILDTYRTFHRTSPKEARKQLDLHINSLGKDEWYNKHLILLITDGTAFEKYSKMQEKAEVFSTTFKQQIANGKSELFAKEYSDLIAESQRSKRYALSFATLYEEAIAEGRSEGFAINYAEEMAECVDFHYKSFEEALQDEFFKVRRSQVSLACIKFDRRKV